jgi:hypothetical protein
MTPATLTVKLALALAMAQTSLLPSDPRLEQVRPQLEEVVNRTTAAGVPAELVISKVREGLAKGVPAERIAAAAARLAENLQTARAFVNERRPGSPPAAELVRALAEARMAGVDMTGVDPLVRGGRPAPETARAVEVLTDLSLRGYPASRAAGLVKDLLARDAAAVARLPAALEVLRREQALSQGDTVDALARGLHRTGSLEQASTRAADEARRKGPAPGSRGAAAEAQARKETFVPPGQIRKQMRAMPNPSGPPAEKPGRGNNPNR